MNMNLIIKGMRPKTLIAAFVPPVCAYGLFHLKTDGEALFYLSLCILLALFIQIATNFYNDAIDFLKGADDNRVGPERITTQDKLNPKHVFYIGHLFILLAFMVGIPLVLKDGIVFLILGIISLLMAYSYTGGPFPLAYLGLGEVFVFLFFGLVATIGSYFLYYGAIDLDIFVLASQIGLLSCVLIAINNYRDKDTDILVNKKTLATRISKDGYLKLLDIFLFLPYFFVLYFVFKHHYNFIFMLLSIPLAYKVRAVIHGVNKPEELNEALALSGKHLFFFSLFFTIIALWT